VTDVFGVETIHLDLAPLAGALSRRLHEAGVPVTPARAADFARSLTLVRPITRRRLYWTARAVFVSDPAQVKVFDEVFLSVFGRRDDRDDFEPEDVRTAGAPPDERPRSPHRTSLRDGDEADPHATVTSSSPGTEDDDDDLAEVEVPLTLASDEELLGHRSFDTLDPHELAQLYRLMSRLELATPRRRTRRYEKGRHGERVDMRRTLRGSLRTGGDPIRLARRRRRIARRRLVMLSDISGSMEPYARAYLQFLTCAASAGPRAEAFVFATRLTRLTRALGSRNPERAIQRAAAAAPDWSSGTRIGDALREFNDRHGRRGMARGAVVVIISDGWDTGDPEVLRRAMERLSRVAHRIVWVNPRTQSPEYQPLAGGMAAAWPYCDAVVSAHSLNALDELTAALAHPGLRR
jgi:uncharacterized protein with von Willebrand factor type A (vWA) domain